jgi:radical SAM superfamily enzyme YgiQ (UPF0313 family)
MNIKIILPTSYGYKNRLNKAKKAIIPNLGIRYLAGMVPPEHSVSVVEEVVEDLNFDEVVDLVAISVNAFNARRAYEVANEYRSRGKTIVMGGIHASVCYQEALKYANTVVIGEADHTWPQVIDDFIHKRLRRIYGSEQRLDLRNLPQPRYDLIDNSKYLKFPFEKRAIFPIETSRGCPYNCEFCSVSIYWGEKVRHRPIEDVICAIKRTGAKTFLFTDDNFFADYKRAKKLCNALIPLKIKYICQVTTSIVNRPELIRLAANSGCIMVYVGFESIRTESLINAGKSLNRPETYHKLCSLLSQNGIDVYASIMLGFDGDDYITMHETLDNLKNWKVSNAAFFELVPFPGTALYDRLKSEDRLLDDQWWLSQDDESYIVRIRYEEGQVSGINLRNRAIDKFFSMDSIIRRFFPFRKGMLLPLYMNIIVKNKLRKGEYMFW